MRTFRHATAAILASLFASSCFAQITGLRQTSSTSTQIVIGWNYSPASTDCTVAAALDNGSGSNLAPLAYDVDTSKRGAAANDQQARYGFLQNGAYRQFIIGTATVPSDTYPLSITSTQYSWALRQDSLYNIRVTCGASTAAIQASTKQLPPGITYHYPAAITTGGNYATPTPCLTIGCTTIDPGTGIELTQATMPGVQQDAKTQAFATNGTGLSCSAWTNPTNLYSTTSGVYASVTASGFSNACAALFGGAAGLTSFNHGVGSFQFEGYQLSITGYGTTGLETGVAFCLTFNGTTCAGTTNTITLPSLTASTQCIPAGSACPASSLAPIDTTWLPWQYYEGSNPGNSTSGGGNGVIYNQNFGVLVWKGQSDTNQINLHVELTLFYSQPFVSADGGENIVFSNGAVQDSTGLNGYFMTAGNSGGLSYMFWVSDQTNPPTVRYVGDMGFNGMTFAGDATFNASSTAIQGYGPWSDTTPTNFYGIATDTNGKLHLLECEAPASGSSWWTGMYPNGSNSTLAASPASHACPQSSGTGDWVDLTPASGNVLYDPSSTTDSLMDEFAEGHPGGCTLMPTPYGSYPCFTGIQGNATQVNFPTSDWAIQNVQSSGGSDYVILSARREQNAVAWIIAIKVANPITTSDIQAYQTWMDAADRWDVSHTPHQAGPGTWSMQSGEKCPCGPSDGTGPWSTTTTASFTNSQSYICVTSTTPSEGNISDIFNEIGVMAVGDILYEATASDHESMLITSISGSSCGSGTEVNVTRGVNDSTAQAGGSGDTIEMASGQSYLQNSAKVEWNFGDSNVKYGDLTGSDPASFFLGGYTPIPASPACSPTAPCPNNTPPPVAWYGGHESFYFGPFSNYDIGELGYACNGLASPGANCTSYLLERSAPFGVNNGSTGNPDFSNSENSDYQAHPASPQGQYYAANTMPIATDEDILNESTPGVCSTPSLVTGDLYKCTPTYPLLYKGAAITVVDGVSPLTDVSGHNSVITSTGTDTYCYVYAAGECQSGSTVGTLYVDDANVSTSSKCDFLGSSGNEAFTYYEHDQLCVTQLPQNQNGVQAEAMIGTTSLNGAYSRMLTDSMSPFGLFYGFATNHGFGSMKYSLYDAQFYGTQNGVLLPRGGDLFLAQIPSWNPVSTPGYDYQWVAVTIPAPPSSLSATTWEVLFGYDANFYCTSRQEVCGAHNTSVNTADPFDFELTDTFTRPSCLSGSTILVPVIPNRVAYYIVKLYNSAGVLVSQSAVKTLAAL